MDQICPQMVKPSAEICGTWIAFAALSLPIQDTAAAVQLTSVFNDGNKA